MSIAKQRTKVSKEPHFVGPDDIPLLPKFITDQNPDQAGHYHLLLKEWWESVYENLNRLREMVVNFQVQELREDTQTDLTSAKNELSDFANTLVDDLNSQVTTSISNLDSTLSGQITSHINDTGNPHGVSASQLGLHAVATSGDYDDLSDTPSLATVATSGDYDDLTDKPTIPTVPGNATQTDDGLMSSTDKTKLDGIPASGGSVSFYNKVGTATNNEGTLVSITSEQVTSSGQAQAKITFTTTTGSITIQAFMPSYNF